MPPEPPASSTSSIALTDITFQSAYDWSLQRLHGVADSSKKAFAYVVGIRLPADPSSRPGDHASSPHPVKQSQGGSRESSPAWNFAGVFSSIRGANGRPERLEANLAQSVGWTEGEVHAELVKDDNGDFKYRYLLVDIPRQYREITSTGSYTSDIRSNPKSETDSRTRKPLRIFVEKGQGFREGEGVFMWGS